jgi:hypothetical protein
MLVDGLYPEVKHEGPLHLALPVDSYVGGALLLVSSQVSYCL